MKACAEVDGQVFQVSPWAGGDWWARWWQEAVIVHMCRHRHATQLLEAHPMPVKPPPDLSCWGPTEEQGLLNSGP